MRVEERETQDGCDKEDIDPNRDIRGDQTREEKQITSCEESVRL